MTMYQNNGGNAALFNIFFLLLSLFFSVPVFAQQADSLPFISLEKLVVQSVSDVGTRDINNRRKDPQSRTEKLLNYIPGVGIISRGNFAQEPVLRGMSDGQISITLNDMKIFGACTDRMDPATSYVEPINLKSVEVSYGPGNHAGGSSMGGGINFELKQPELHATPPVKAMLGTGFETNGNLRQVLGSLQFSKNKLGIFVNGTYRKGGNYTPGGNKNDLQNSFAQWSKEAGFSVDNKSRILFSQYQKWNVGLSAKYHLAAHHYLLADAIIDHGKNIGYPALTMDVAFANAHIFSAGHVYENASKKLSLWETKLYTNFVRHAMDDTKRPPAQVFMHMDMPGNSFTSGFFSKAAYAVSAKQKVNIKLEAFVNRWHAEMTMYPANGGSHMFMLTIPDAQRSAAALEASDEIAVNPHLQLTAGGRLEYNRSSIFSSIGKLQLTSFYTANAAQDYLVHNVFLAWKYDMHSHWQLAAKLATAGRAPTLKELYAFYLFNRADGYDYVGNPALKNETSQNLDVRIKFRNKRIAAEAKGFTYYLHNYMAGVVQPNMSVMTNGAKGVKKYTATGDAILYGAEVAGMWQPIKNIRLTSANTFLKGMDAQHNYLPLISPFKSVNKVDWTPTPGLAVFGESVYAAAQKNVSIFYGETSTPAYNIYNAGVSKRMDLKTSSLMVSLQAENIFNQYYTDHLDVIKLPRQGRNVSLRLNYNF